MEVVRSTEMDQSSFFIYADKYGKILVLWLAHKFHAESLLRLIPSTFQLQVGHRLNRLSGCNREPLL